MPTAALINRAICTHTHTHTHTCQSTVLHYSHIGCRRDCARRWSLHVDHAGGTRDKPPEFGVGNANENLAPFRSYCAVRLVIVLFSTCGYVSWTNSFSAISANIAQIIGEILQKLDFLSVWCIVGFGEITQNNGYYAIQGHSRSSILIPIESKDTTF